MLTRRGWSLIGAAAGLYVGSRLLGLVQLAVLGIAAALLVLVAYIWVRAHPPALTARRDLKERLQVGVDGRVEPTGEFMTLRDYAPGDDLRHVHWRSTARRGHLMMRQNETRRRAPVLLMLDVRPGAHDRATFERAVEACASIATALDHMGRPFDVVWSTGTLVGVPGRRHLATVMDELAIVQPHGPDRMVVVTTRRRTSALI